jgi:hypothetical protein
MSDKIDSQIDYDCLGYCVKCHKNLIKSHFYDNKWHEGLSPEYDTTEFFLNNSTRMRVVICKSCKTNLSDNDYPNIMTAVKKGWAKELQIVNWNIEKKYNYMEKYNKLEIVSKSENLSDIELDKKIDKKVIEMKEK